MVSEGIEVNMIESTLLFQFVSRSPSPFPSERHVTMPIELPEPAKIVMAGAMSGIVSTGAIHPMDTIRTRLQTSRNFNGVFDCAAKTIRNEVRAVPLLFFCTFP